MSTYLDYLIVLRVGISLSNYGKVGKSIKVNAVKLPGD